MSVFGVGVNDLDSTVFIDGKHLRFYRCWHNMLERCYSSDYQRKYPTYIGCTVCEDWKILSIFKEWFDANYIEGYCLDKDILSGYHKVYSPVTCIFLHPYLNRVLSIKPKIDLDTPSGVERCGKKFRVRLKRFGKYESLGIYDNVSDAREVFVSAKLAHVKELLDIYEHRDNIKTKVVDLFKTRLGA